MIKETRNKNMKIFFIYFFIVLAVFGNALFNQFVYDDGYLIVRNEFIRDFRHLGKLLTSDVTITSPIDRASGYYRPVSMIFLMFVYKLWGLNPFGLHLTNILIHCINSFLVFLLIKRISQKDITAFIAGLIFAVHPIHVEAVVPIYNFMGLLATFFALGSFLAFINSDGMKKRTFLLLSVLLFFLAMFSKEEVLLLPVIFIFYDLYFTGHFRLKADLKRYVSYMWFFAVSVCYILARYMIIEKDAAFGLWNVQVTFNITPAQNIFFHLLTIFKIFFLYLGMLLLPIRLNAIHLISSVSSISDFQALAGVAAVFCAVAAIIFYKKRNPAASFFILMFFISSFMISNIIPIGSIFAERFMYFPSITYCFFFGSFITYGIEAYKKTKDGRSKFIILIGITFVILYASQTSARNYIWRNDVSLWRDTAKKSPASFFAHVNLAKACDKVGLYKEALDEYIISLQFPSSKKAHIHNAIGKVYGKIQMYDEALREFDEAAALDNTYAEFYYNIGITHFNKKDLSKAMVYFNLALEKDDTYPWSYYGLGLVYAKKGSTKKAREMFSEALRQNPSFITVKKALKEMDSDSKN